MAAVPTPTIREKNLIRQLNKSKRKIQQTQKTLKDLNEQASILSRQALANFRKTPSRGFKGLPNKTITNQAVAAQALDNPENRLEPEDILEEEPALNQGPEEEKESDELPDLKNQQKNLEQAEISPEDLLKTKNAGQVEMEKREEKKKEKVDLEEQFKIARKLKEEQGAAKTANIGKAASATEKTAATGIKAGETAIKQAAIKETEGLVVKTAGELAAPEVVIPAIVAGAVLKKTTETFSFNKRAQDISAWLATISWGTVWGSGILLPTAWPGLIYLNIHLFFAHLWPDSPRELFCPLGTEWSRMASFSSAGASEATTGFLSENSSTTKVVGWLEMGGILICDLMFVGFISIVVDFAENHPFLFEILLKAASLFKNII